MSSGFTKTFRLLALVLLVCVMQVYVLARPAMTSVTPTVKKSEVVNKPIVTDHQLNFIKRNQVVQPTTLASERALTFAPKSPLPLAFTKSSAEQLAATTAFLKVKQGGYDPMAIKGAPTARPQSDDNDGDDDGDKKALIITSVILIGAAVALFIAFNHDRDDDGIRGQ